MTIAAASSRIPAIRPVGPANPPLDWRTRPTSGGTIRPPELPAMLIATAPTAKVAGVNIRVGSAQNAPCAAPSAVPAVSNANRPAIVGPDNAAAVIAPAQTAAGMATCRKRSPVRSEWREFK